MDKELRGQLFTAMMRFKKIEAAFSTECEIQMNELTILQIIAGNCSCGENCGTNLNMPEIQKKLQISKPAVSYILNTLEKKNYISREIDPKDRRKISITTTPEGKLAAEQSTRKCNEMWDVLLTRFGKDDMQNLVGFLMRLAELCEQIQEEKTAND